MVDRICTVCGRRVLAEQVVRSRYPDVAPALHALIESVRKKQRRPRPKEQECHRVWLPSGGGSIGHWVEHEGLCGPLRESNAQDDFRDQLGVEVAR